MDTTGTLSASGRPLPRNWLAVIVIIWLGQAVSIVTSYAAGFAATWYITETTGSALWLSLAAMCAYLPQGLLSPFGGVVADRFNRKSVMIAADLSIGALSALIGLVILAGHLEMWMILALVIGRSVGQAFHGPAMMAAMPLIVPARHLLRINTLDQLLMSIAGIGAPALGIMLYTAFGLHTAMFLDALGALIAVAGLALAAIPTTHDLSMEDQHVLANLADGWRALSANRGLLLLIVGITLGMIIFAPMSALYPLMTYEHFGGDGWMASIAEATFAGGLLAGSAVLMAWGGGKRLAGLIAFAMTATGLVTIACGLLPSDLFWAFAVLCAVMAFVCAWFSGPMMTLVQRNVPNEKLGRAVGFTTALIGLSSPIGIALGGVGAEMVGIAPFFVIDGLLCLILGLTIYLPRSIRALDAPEPATHDDGDAA